MKINHIICLQKGLTGFFVLLLIIYYHQSENPTAWIYLALHGGYGILWNLKSIFFPDRNWDKKTNLLFAIVGFFSLCLYWVAPWLLTSRGTIAPDWYQAVVIMIFIVGVFLHFASDMHK
jgi:hypothetical protein